ncbi:hypothetical protein EHV15_28415 [Paenibacillus oralis]|uniref:Uncharacterized protein n=1 Tax=Paenibacillus oralis TaxID=2490856 RepID=A0A3P3UA22_9BACL|nr:hypothetical protein [Paenibacillus oralis]RRJ66409.1 hypothetical protein EHV15_28415 [Paenibacillus oralis]
MIFENKQYRQSPVPTQSFIWVAEYYDNTYLSEFDLNTKKPNNFYDIDKEKIIKFGLIGEGSQIFFDVANGIFNINGNRIMVSYVTDVQEYPLTGRTFLYNDIITYKNAIAEADFFSSGLKTSNQQITEYSLGYKKKMELEGVHINFFNILHLPYRQCPYFEIKISSNQDLDGKLIIRVNGLTVNAINAPLVKNQMGVINWEIK